jgi:cytochrome b561
MMDEQNEKYDGATISVHWITALLVALLWVIGQTGDWLPKGTLQSAYWSTHVVLGFALVVLVIYRIGWRATAGRRLPPADPAALHVLAKASHYALYILLIVVLALGVTNAFVRGYHIFGLFELPQLGDKSLRKPITNWHGLAANILLGLAALHALAALGHHYVLRDGVLRRMMPSPRRPLIYRGARPD